MSMPFFATRSLGFAVIAALGLTLPSLARAEGPLDAFLPKSGKIIGHVMKLGVAPEDQAIDRQFRVAVQNNMEWFKNYVRGQKSGGPLPYDKRMGITEAQYQKLQHMHADFQPGEAVEVDIGRAADGVVSFSTKSAAAAELNKVTFPAGEKVADTAHGKLDIFNTIHQTDARAPIGVWTGAEWAHVAKEDSDQPSSKIAFGKRDPSGEGVMYYMIAPTKDHEERSLVIFYKID